MTLGSEVSAALGELRLHAESLMVDSCTITIPSPGVWDEATGTYLGAKSQTYAGPCRVQRSNASPRDVSAGEARWVLSEVIVSVPVEAPAAPVGAVVEIGECAFDPHLAGSSFAVLSHDGKTHGTARRYRCAEAVR